MADGGSRPEAGPALDERIANAWRPVVDEVFGGWRYRWAAGVTRRANSALALTPARPVAELVDHAEAFYRERGQPPCILVSTASTPGDVPEYLRSRGYRAGARTLVLAAATSDVLERTAVTSLRTSITDDATDRWFGTYWSVEAGRGRSDADAHLVREVLLAPGLPTTFVTVLDNDEVLGVGQSVSEHGWAGVQCMATVPGHRRRGVATAALHALADDAAQRGVDAFHLAVMADNEGARRLYERAGFAATHEYCYFTLQQTDAGPDAVRSPVAR